jgi:histidinol dehydrogenase
LKIVKGFDLAKSVLTRRVELAGDEREAGVRQILDEVRKRGDAALYDFTEKFDGVKLGSLEVQKDAIQSAYEQVDGAVVEALRVAADRIRAYHTNQKSALVRDSSKGGIGWRMHPLKRVGVHVPGFTAPLPSTVLMTVIPAKVAGVQEVIVVSPPRKEGAISPLTLVAADIAGADRVFSIGGAQAIAALGFGTESVPAVDKVCGPGNIYATLAKKLLYGTVGIDGLQGPSEVLIIVDETTNIEYCAADYLAQAEHSAGTAVLVATSMDLADRIHREIDEQLKALPHPESALESIDKNGIICAVETVEEAIELANLYAPEHLLLMVDKSASYVDQIRNAGCIVFGKKGTVAMGDYAAGPSHVLPTGGTARFASTLSVLDFVKLTSVIDVDDNSLRKLGPTVQTLATAEGLDAHARAVEKRLKPLTRNSKPQTLNSK